MFVKSLLKYRNNIAMLNEKTGMLGGIVIELKKTT